MFLYIREGRHECLDSLSSSSENSSDLRSLFAHFVRKLRNPGHQSMAIPSTSVSGNGIIKRKEGLSSSMVIVKSLSVSNVVDPCRKTLTSLYRRSGSWLAKEDAVGRLSLLLAYFQGRGAPP